MKHHDRKPRDRVPALESRTLGFPRTGEQLSLRTGQDTEREFPLWACVFSRIHPEHLTSVMQANRGKCMLGPMVACVPLMALMVASPAYAPSPLSGL